MMQIIGMSATLPNSDVLSDWLDAEFYHTDFRPVDLCEQYKIGATLYDSETRKVVREIGNDVMFSGDSEHILYLTVETVCAGSGVLIFCPSKNRCESLAKWLAREIFIAGKPTQVKHSKHI